ncbi:MAG: WD40 repeat domain-containing protein, partial [Anaerolineales bacterium]
MVDSAWQAIWSLDGTRLATASADGVARVWDPITGEMMFSLQGRILDRFRIAW